MDPITATIIYKVTTLLVGFGFCILGYLLFSRGVFESPVIHGTKEGTEIEAKYKDVNLSIKRAAPGTIFAIFGAVIVTATIIQGFHVEKTNTGGRFTATEKKIAEDLNTVIQNIEGITDAQSYEFMSLLGRIATEEEASSGVSRGTASE